MKDKPVNMCHFKLDFKELVKPNLPTIIQKYLHST